MMRFDNIKSAARIYWDAMERPPNGFGQHCDQIHGATHVIMYKMNRQFGHNETEKALDSEYASRYTKPE